MGLEAGTVVGGYRIESFVARGGMGVVYSATQLALQRTVALKLVAPELAHDQAFRERFKREAQLAASLDHPNILPVYEAGEADGVLFLAMRYVVGTDLDSLIRRERVLRPDRAVAIVNQIASALDAAHARGLVHRDVKPGNILIANEYGQERAYLTDFGLTKSSTATANLTRTGDMVGTVDYVAPEQVQGHTVDGSADTYALACVLYRAVTGQVPFAREGDVAKMYAHLNDPPPSAAAASPGVSAELDAVIRTGMAKRPDDRYSSSGAFADAARATLGASAGDPTQVGPTLVDPTQIDPTLVDAPPPITPAAPEGQPLLSGRRPLYLGGAAALLAIVVAIAVIAAGGGGRHDSTTSPPPTTSTVASTSTTPPTTSTSTTTADPATAQAAAYHASVARIVPRMQAVFRRFPQGSDFDKPAFSATALADAAGLRGIADNLDALSPPSFALVDHEALVTHLRAMEQAFRALATASDNRDFTGAQKDLERTRAALAQVNDSVKRVLRKRV
jgi:serine/threonine protein kinase